MVHYLENQATTLKEKNDQVRNVSYKALTINEKEYSSFNQ